MQPHPGGPAVAPPAHRDPGTPHPIDALHREHAVILAVLDAIEAEARRAQVSFEVRLGFWLPALDFLEHYTDRDHHGKEDLVLFPALARAGLGTEHGPLATMRAEHEEGHAARARMVGTLASQDVPGLADAARRYCQSQRRHIEREEQVLFPLALELLDEDATERLRTGFAAHERLQDEAERERLRRLAAALTHTAGGAEETAG